MAAFRAQPGGADRGLGHRRDAAGAADAGADRGGHGGGAGQRHRRVMRDEARLLHRVDQRPRVVRRGLDADRGDPHRCPVGVAVDAGLLRRGAGEHRGDRAPGGGTEEIERPAFGHAMLPGDQGGRQFAWVDGASHQQAAKQHGLLGVVGDGAGRHPGRDRVPGRRGLEAGKHRAPALRDLPAGKQLRGHAKSVADRQAVQSAPGPVRFLP